MLKYNGSILKLPSKAIVDYTTPPAPPLPSDMDFVYQAKDFDGTKIVNKATNSTFGDYLAAGTITLNGSGSNAYLSNNLERANYLYKDITSGELDKFKAINSTYTYFIRVMQTTNGIGAIVSFRYSYDEGYIYMIRGNNCQLQIHTTTGIDLGSNFSLTTDRVYKVIVNGSAFQAKNLDTDYIYDLSYSTNRRMGTKMTSFNGYNAYDASLYPEGFIDRFYALAGIARATTSEEDTIIKDALMNQSA